MDEITKKDFSGLEEKLDLTFNHKNYLIEAFTHRSYLNENKELTSQHNERLEFLGDSVLGMLVSEFLFKEFPEAKEGEMSSLRSQLVDASFCTECVNHLQVEPYLLLGKGEMMNSGRGRDSILADLFEALLAAIYLDMGFEKVKNFFFSKFSFILINLIKQPQQNWKALLQDYYQKKLRKQPIYKLLSEEGPHHQKIFFIAVMLDDVLLGNGQGNSKKQAEQEAAKEAYKKIMEENHG